MAAEPRPSRSEGATRPGRLRLLGDSELCHLDGPVPLTPSAQRLLAHLAVVHRGRPVRRVALAERLWPDTPPARGVATLRSVLWRLPRPRRRQLATCTSTSVRLSEHLEVDLWEAERLASSVSTDPGRDESPDGLGLLAADLLPDWHDPWLLADQEAHRQQRLHALERAAARLTAAGRYADALAAGLGAVQSEPVRESAHRRVIEVHLAEGNQAEALRQYDGYRRLLARELGLPPSPAIRRLVAPLLGRPVDG